MALTVENRKGIEYAMTYDECARVLGVSRSMIYLIERDALKKARKILKRHGYSVTDFLTTHRKASQ